MGDIIDKYGLPISRSCPVPPGDCEPGEHRKLQDDVEFYYNQPRRCEYNMSSGEMLMRTIDANLCAIARTKINKTCFRGGNQTHREEENNAYDVLANCQSLMKRVFDFSFVPDE